MTAGLPTAKPPRLRPGDFVGLVAPARALPDRDSLVDAIAALEGWGLQVRIGAHVEDRVGYLAGRDEDRAADLHTMWADPKVRAIVCLGAGYGSSRVIRHLDRELIAANPKAICGYSDTTALHLAVHAWSSTISLYSVGAADLESPATSDWSKATLHRALFSAKPFGEIARHPADPPVRTIVGGTATGRLVGGCLPVLTATIGTPIEIETEGRILVLEDVHDRPLQEIDRSLVHLRDADKLEDVTGIVVSDVAGRPLGPSDRSLDDVLADLVGSLGVPVVAGLPIGHGRHHATVPLGAVATLDGDAGRLMVDEVITADS